MRRSLIKPKRSTPRRRLAPRATAREWVVLIAELIKRSANCHVCGGGFTRTDPPENHHRLRRRDGGDRLSNLLRIHRSCHQHITEHPASAIEWGHMVRTGFDPAEVPALLWFTGRPCWYLLDDNGGFTSTTPPKENT